MEYKKLLHYVNTKIFIIFRIFLINDFIFVIILQLRAVRCKLIDIIWIIVFQKFILKNNQFTGKLYRSKFEEH